MASAIRYTPTKSASLSRSQYGSHGGHCVCQICTCSKHKCPPGLLPYSPDALLTTMKNDYPAHPVGRAYSAKKPYQYEPTNYTPDLLKTTNQNDYTPKKGSQPYRHPREEAVYNSSPFNGETEYNTNYLKNQVYPIARSSPHKAQPILSTAPFQGQTTYADNYKGSPVQSRHPVKPQHYTHVNVPFDGQTTYNQEYKEYEVPRTNNHKPAYSYTPTPFEGNTSYQDQYKKYGQNVYQKDPCPVDYLPQLPRNCSPGKNHLHYREDTQQWE